MPKIFIDAGHGGADPGASSKTIQEKNIALQIALKLNDLLKKNNLKTELSRSTDVFITPFERAKKANNSKADIFVSVHLNAAIDITASGIETLAYKNNKLATNIQKELISMTGARDRGVKERHDLAVLNSTKMPAVLIEVGFISNESEKNLLLTNAYQNKIARAIANGIFQYFDLGVIKKMAEITNVKDALKVLQQKGVINSEAYWLKAIDVVKYLNTLIINMANKLS